MPSFKITIWIKQNKKKCQLWLLFILLTFVFTILHTKNNKPASANTETRDLDSYIPEGFVLVPVELSNGSSLNGLLEQKGIVDLYTGNPSQQKVEKAAEAVKIIRSPRNPSHFAVLVPEDKASFLIQRFQSFHAVIQNPKQKKKTAIKPINKKRKRNIIIDIHN